MITFKPTIDDIKEYQRGNLPGNAVRIDAPHSIDEMLKKAAPIEAVLCMVLFLAMFIKTIVNHDLVINPIAVVLGFIIGFLLLAVHELLHAVVYPKDANVTVGKLKGKLVFVALASFPMSRQRFILMSLLPFVLGIVPLLVFIILPAEYKIVNGLMFGMAGMGMVSPYVDVYNVIIVLRQARRIDKIMFFEDDLYKICE